MSFNYSGDPTTSMRDEIRFLVNDVDPSFPLLQDAEVDYLIGKWMPLYYSTLYTASIAAAQIARNWADSLNVTDGSASIAVGDLQGRYTLMAQQLRDEYEAEGDVGGLINLDNILTGTTFDPSIEPLQTSIGLDDNPRAGRQNWGGLFSSIPYGEYDAANEGVLG